MVSERRIMLDEIIDPRFMAIDIRAFRRLRDVRLDGLSRVNIIVGSNNSGKTSLLEAIEACCHPLNIEAWLEIVLRRESRQPMEEQFAAFWPNVKSDLENEVTPKSLEIHYERRGERRDWKVLGIVWRINRYVSDDNLPNESKTEQASRSLTRLTTRVSLQLVPKTIEVSEELSPSGVIFEFRSGEPLSKIKSPEDVTTVSLTPTSHRDEVFQIKMMSAFDAPDFRNEVHALLKEFDAGVESVDLGDPEAKRSYIRVYHQRTGYMPIAAFGDGFRRVLTYALAVIRCRNGGVLLIDEIETAIHYSALRNVYRWLVKACTEHRVQLFVTTHSLEAVDALLEATPEELDTSFYRLHDEGGKIQVVRFDEAELRVLRQDFGDEVRG
jgi:predicted ATPase